jgi:MFS family permease
VSPQAYGVLLSLDAAVVVLFQFWVTRKIRPYAPMLMMMVGTLFYLVGFTMYGFVASYALFIVAILLITIGEMVVMPVSQALVARFAPPDMRGRYMAVFGLSWTIPSAIGPWAAGLILDNYDPNWVWYAAGIISAVAAAGFYLLHLRAKDRFGPRADEERRATVEDR